MAGKPGIMDETVTIASRFNGPPTSGNGGYSCGLLAAFIDGPARVRLHAPPPLDRPLAVRRGADDRIELFDGEERIGSATPAAMELEPPSPPSYEDAVRAARGYPCYENHIFPTCFVCGPGRPESDGLEIFPGPVSDWSLIACPWTPSPDLVDATGSVRPEIVWSALDCPGYFACLGHAPQPAVLGELQAKLLHPVSGAQGLVVYAWPLGEEGRKRFAGSALATQDGQVLAKARSTWILLRS